MVIREFKEIDRKAVEKIFALYWTDTEFLEELSTALDSYTKGANGFNFLVAEKDGEIIGIASLKKLPDYLRPYSLTNNAIELYVIASKYKRKGIGKKLKLQLIESAQKSGFDEILLFSPKTHDGSWEFHDTFDFERVGEVTPPDDDIGHVWRKILNKI